MLNLVVQLLSAHQCPYFVLAELNTCPPVHSSSPYFCPPPPLRNAPYFSSPEWSRPKERPSWPWNPGVSVYLARVVILSTLFTIVGHTFVQAGHTFVQAGHTFVQVGAGWIPTGKREGATCPPCLLLFCLPTFFAPPHPTHNHCTPVRPTLQCTLG